MVPNTSAKYFADIQAPAYDMFIHTPFACFCLSSVKVFCKCISPLLYLPAVFHDRSSHPLAAFGLSFLSCFLHPAAQGFVCLGCVVCAVLPSSFPSLPSPLLSSLPSPNIFGLQLVCFCATPWVQVAETKLPPPLLHQAACVSGQDAGAW